MCEEVRVLKDWLTADKSDHWASKQTNPMVDLRAHSIMGDFQRVWLEEADHCVLNTLGSIFCLSLCFLDTMRQRALSTMAFSYDALVSLHAQKLQSQPVMKWTLWKMGQCKSFLKLYFLVFCSRNIKLNITACDFIFLILYFSALYFTA